MKVTLTFGPLGAALLLVRSDSGTAFTTRTRTTTTTTTLPLRTRFLSSFGVSSSSSSSCSSQKVTHRVTGNTRRWYASSSSSDDKDFVQRHSVRTSVLHFLTQRAVQSFLFLVYSCRDPHTVRWMEEFCQTRNLLNYHGTGAFNTTRFSTPDAFLEELMQRPPTVVVVQARRQGRNQGGWSKNNPYLQERFAEYQIEIDPLSLASRILSVREQIAKEFAVDLNIVAKASEEILYSYASRLKGQPTSLEEAIPQAPQDNSQGGLSDLDAAMAEAKSRTDDNDADDFGGLLQDDNDDDDDNDKMDLVAAATVAGLLGEDEKDMPAIFAVDQDDDDDGGGGGGMGNPKDDEKAAFDRVYMMMLNNQIAFEEQTASPLRKGNFDLLYNLVTQESIHRVLKEYRDTSQQVNGAWLLRFYAQHLKGYFDGPVRYGRADDFLEKLLTTAPSLVEDGSAVGLLDPVGMAERILQERAVVAADFQQEVNAVLQGGQFELRKELLARQMERSAAAADTAQMTSEASSSSSSSLSSSEPTLGMLEAGDFE